MERFCIFRQNLSSSLFKMGQNHYLLRKSLHYKQVSELKCEKRHFKFALILQVLLMTHLSSIAISLYFYWRHNAYCEPGIYSGEQAINSKKSDINFIWRNLTTIFSIFPV